MAVYLENLALVAKFVWQVCRVLGRLIGMGCCSTLYVLCNIVCCTAMLRVVVCSIVCVCVCWVHGCV